MDLLSAQIILTADTENTKAVLSTKVAPIHGFRMITTDSVHSSLNSEKVKISTTFGMTS